MYDCHLHTKYSFDGRNEMAEVCRQSIQHGMKGICFTDHVDFDATEKGRLTDFVADIPAYQVEFQQVQAQFGGELEMGCGLEVGMQIHLLEKNRKLVAKTMPDFVIGSVHGIEGKDIYHGQFSAGKSQNQAYLGYLERTLDLVKSHDYFHVLGHLDMILRDDTFTDKTFDKAEYHLMIDDILRGLIQAGKGIEVNSSGWRYGLNGPHPAFFIIKRFYDLGGRVITTGSDSHYDNSINQDIGKVTGLLKEAGFTEISFFLEGKEGKRRI